LASDQDLLSSLDVFGVLNRITFPPIETIFKPEWYTWFWIIFEGSITLVHQERVLVEKPGEPGVPMIMVIRPGRSNKELGRMPIMARYDQGRVKCFNRLGLRVMSDEEKEICDRIMKAIEEKGLEGITKEMRDAWVE
jgi:hypothetical protein